MKCLRFILLLISVLCGVIGCGRSEAPPPPGPAVSVSHPIEHEVVEWDEYSGHLESPNTVNIAARVSGVIEEAPFDEGAIVHQGDVLFVVDERPFKAEVESRNADVGKAQAQLAQAQLHFNRYDKIRKTNAISAEDYDQAISALKTAEAELKVAEAARDVARLNLEWTRVTAPISGRISKKLVTKGNLVNGGAGLPTLLTTITSIDPLYCYVNVPERAFLKYQAIAKKLAEANGIDDRKIPCAVELEGEKTFGHPGKLDFIDNHIDQSTGTIQIRGAIPNADGSLAPGLFARLRVPGSTPYRALLVPDIAVGTDQNSKFLYTLGKDDVVQSTRVTLGPLFGTLRAVKDGLKADDRVVINALQAARPGTKVTPTEVPIPAEAVATLEQETTMAKSVPQPPGTK